MRDLDQDGEPEVVVDLYTGGAHCCVVSQIFRYRSARDDYRPSRAFWGNPGYGFADYDGDGRPELVTRDDRFAYAFTAYAASVSPIRIWHYDAGALVDVTRDFPAVIARDAAELWRLYGRFRRSRFPEVRGVLAAYLADKALLGEEEEGWRRLRAALARGELGRAPAKDGYAAGARYLEKLRTFLRTTGYISS